VENRVQKDDMLKSLVTGLLVCVPSFCLSVYIMETRINWPAPAVITAAILCAAAANFALIVFLEYYRRRLGALTLPALLTEVGIVMLFVIAGSINRYYADFGYGWLAPLVAFYLCLSTLAIFREKTLLLKCHLGLNAVMLAVLCSLGAADRIALPF
jgi:hypothetical protein